MLRNNDYRIHCSHGWPLLKRSSRFCCKILFAKSCLLPITYKVLPVKQKCKGKVGIPACKVKYWFDDKHEHDIGLMRLSKPMRGMRRLKLSTKTPQPRAKLTMTGTGKHVTVFYLQQDVKHNLIFYLYCQS